MNYSPTLYSIPLIYRVSHSIDIELSSQELFDLSPFGISQRLTLLLNIFSILEIELDRKDWSPKDRITGGTEQKWIIVVYSESILAGEEHR